MADLHGKRKYAGAPVAERRKQGTDAIIDIRKMPPHKQPREYVMVAVETHTSILRTEHKFKTRAQMEAAKVEMRKKVEGKSAYRNRYFKWRDDTHKYSLEFECSTPSGGPEHG